jgi:hypothetical protein
MAEVLKRWNGSQWVTVAMVNRIEIGVEVDDVVLKKPTYGQSPRIPTGNYTLKPREAVVQTYSYSIE